MGVLSSTDAYLFLFELNEPSQTAPKRPTNDQNLANVPEDPVSDDSPLSYFERDILDASLRRGQGGSGGDVSGKAGLETANGPWQRAEGSGLRLLYLWLGREADAMARKAARAQVTR